ncbi:hypothetical protein PENSPDRAFT_757168 [Peniophora sp. CONT]|nr:hypothetical protein PENSPDRAFT_757168 [Peniophora sp. CONT]
MDLQHGADEITAWPWIAAGAQHLDRLDSELMRGTSDRSKDNLEKNVTALRALTAQFSKRLNRLQSAVHSLPPDLLHDVFALVAQDELPNASSLGWVKLGHVCSRFREILLECHALWAQNVTAITHASEDFIQRAGETPITLNLATDEDEESNLFFTYMVQARCITVLHEESSITLRGCLIEAHLPLLEKLYIDACPHLAIDGPRPASHELPDHNLGTTSSTAVPLIAPNLRSLHLRGIYVPFSPETLVQLKLEHILAEVFDRSAEPLLQIIGRCCLLQELCLRWAIPAKPSQTSSSGEPRTIRLPRLKRLLIEDEEMCSEAMWSILSVPTTAAVTFIPQCPPTISGGMEISAARIIPAFSDHARDCDPVSLRLSFRGTGYSSRDDKACLLVSVASCRDTAEPWTPWATSEYWRHIPEDKSLNLVFMRKRQDQFRFQDFLGLRNNLLSGIRDRSSIRSLEISYNSESGRVIEAVAESRPDWQAVLSAFPGLESFTIHGPGMSPLRALSVQVHMVAPRLHTLCIARTVVVSGPSVYASFGIRLDELIETLRYRAAAGSPLRSLKLPEAIRGPAESNGGREVDIPGELGRAFNTPDWPGVPPVLEYNLKAST